MDMRELVKGFLEARGSNTAECARRLGYQRSILYDKYRRGTFYVSDLERIAEAYGYEVEIKFRKKK